VYEVYGFNIISLKKLYENFPYNGIILNMDITKSDCCILLINCNKAEEGFKTIEWTDNVLNTMAIDNLFGYVGLYLNNKMQIFIDSENNLDV